MTDYLTSEQILFIHFTLIEETGGRHGVRDIALLQSAVSRPKAIFDKKELYPEIFSKASCLFHSIIKNHPFIDGNKRTAVTSAFIFLIRNGYEITVENKELEKFTLKMAEEQTEIEKIAKWFKKYSVKKR